MRKLKYLLQSAPFSRFSRIDRKTGFSSLGALLSKGKEEGATIGALAGAVILATYKANEQAQKTNLPVYVEEDGKLYEIKLRNEKRSIKNIPKPNFTSPQNFKLK